ncbi:MAG: DUF2231 domain-containing protein [Telluria sp.]
MQSSAPLAPPGPYLGLSSQPVYATLVQFPAVCFVLTLLTDLAYWQTFNVQWETFSVWLLTAGCIVAAFAAIAALISWYRYPHVRLIPLAGPHVLTSLLALILAIVNAFVHSRDGYVAVVPQGLALSVIVVLLMLLATWFGWPRPHYAVPAGGVR